MVGIVVMFIYIYAHIYIYLWLFAPPFSIYIKIVSCTINFASVDVANDSDHFFCFRRYPPTIMGSDGKRLKLAKEPSWLERGRERERVILST